MATTDQTLRSRAASMFGGARAATWAPAELAVWEQLHAAEQTVRDAVDTAVEHEHDLTVSQLLLLGRLAIADERTMRLTALADDAGLSLSRVSRIAVTLEQRGLMVRRTCPSDARAVNATLTDAGADLVAAAQTTAAETIQDTLLAHLDADETAQLAALLARISEPGAPICTRGPDEVA